MCDDCPVRYCIACGVPTTLLVFDVLTSTAHPHCETHAQMAVNAQWN